jgi:hypothetical protein
LKKWPIVVSFAKVVKDYIDTQEKKFLDENSPEGYDEILRETMKELDDTAILLQAEGIVEILGDNYNHRVLQRFTQAYMKKHSPQTQ